MKVAKRMFAALAAVLVTAALLTLSACSCARKLDVEYLQKISEMSDVDLTQGNVISDVDIHSSFLSNGERMVTVSLAQTDVGEKIAASGVWRDLPLNDTLSGFTEYPISENIDVPEPENGRYLFFDRHSEAADPHDETAFADRDSYNFTVAVYDSDSEMLYVYELDT